MQNENTRFHDRLQIMSTLIRRYSTIDRLLIGLQALAPPPLLSAPPSTHPGSSQPEARMESSVRRQVARLMRINHAGEVSAQALYRGQAIVAQRSGVRAHLLAAADEERIHLQWCATRLSELGDRPSLLSPFWYASSFAIGAMVGLAGDRVSLGFVEETERQVEIHLQDHLQRLPLQDLRSRKILEAMERDEARHGREAHDAGARPLPRAAQRLMWLTSGVMKFGAFRV